MAGLTTPRPDLSPPPTPSRRTYSVLGLPHGTTVEKCIQAFERLGAHYDPRRHPGHQVWAICHQNDLDEALALIVDAERWEGRAA